MIGDGNEKLINLFSTWLLRRLDTEGYGRHHSRDLYALATGRVARARTVVPNFRRLTWLTLPQLTG